MNRAVRYPLLLITFVSLAAGQSAAKPSPKHSEAPKNAPATEGA